jgi:signal peptidase I
MAILLACMMLAIFFTTAAYRLYHANIFHAIGMSMYPKYHSGDFLLTRPTPLDQTPPGTSIVFTTVVPTINGYRKMTLVKELVAVGPAVVSFSPGKFLVNSEKQNYSLPYGGPPFISQVVPSGCMFVTGVNWGNSLDSREIGPLCPVGKVMRVEHSFPNYFALITYFYLHPA